LTRDCRSADAATKTGERNIQQAMKPPPHKLRIDILEEIRCIVSLTPLSFTGGQAFDDTMGS